MVRAALVFALYAHLLPGLVARGADDRAELEARIVARYAAHVHATYAAVLREAEVLRARVRELCAGPSAAALLAAREAWCVARRSYGESEVFRFQGGPIDDPHTGVERFLNAWPLDEAWLDAVVGSPESGIINRPDLYPVLAPALLPLLNESGGEANVATGWHAIEFLLWGQDLDEAGPGARPWTDFVDGKGRNAARRRQYLDAATELLVRHLTTLVTAWAPTPTPGGYRAQLLASPAGGVRAMLTGMVVLAGFELCGERLAVAYETRDQEEEHSCFSDTTCQDLIANALGIEAVWRGGRGAGAGPGLLELARAVAPELAETVAEAVGRALAALRAIPAPFDRAIQGADDAPGRRAVLAAIESLEALTQSLATLALELGLDVPLRPGD